MSINPTKYAHPEALVETDWLESHLQDEGIRIVESNEDILLYDTGHIPGAVHIDWRADLQDPVIRDYIHAGKICRALQPQRNHARNHLHFLRGQGELVGLLRAMGVSIVWARESENSQRRSGQMEGGTAGR